MKNERWIWERLTSFFWMIEKRPNKKGRSWSMNELNEKRRRWSSQHGTNYLTLFAGGGCQFDPPPELQSHIFLVNPVHCFENWLFFVVVSLQNGLVHIYCRKTSIFHIFNQISHFFVKTNEAKTKQNFAKMRNAKILWIPWVL